MATARRRYVAWEVFGSLGYAVASFPAKTAEGFMSKARILKRQAQGLTAAEIMEEPGLRRIAVSLLQDALDFHGHEVAPPRLERSEARKGSRRKLRRIIDRATLPAAPSGPEPSPEYFRQLAKQLPNDDDDVAF